MTSPVQVWRRNQKEYKNLGKRGEILSFSRINHPPQDYQEWQRYWVAVVELADGTRVTAGLTGTSQPQVGDQVMGVLRRIKPVGEKEVIEYGVKFLVGKNV